MSRGTSFGPRGQPTPLGAVRQVTSHSAQSVGSLAEDLNGSMDKQEQEQHDAREQCYIDGNTCICIAILGIAWAALFFVWASFVVY